jgi:hypothetical protein
MTIRRFGAFSVGKILGSLYAILGLLIGGVFSLLAVLGGMASGQGGVGPGMAFGAAAVIMFPLIYGAIGFVGGILAAVIYNSLASILGGIEIELEQKPGA